MKCVWLCLAVLAACGRQVPLGALPQEEVLPPLDAGTSFDPSRADASKEDDALSNLLAWESSFEFADMSAWNTTLPEHRGRHYTSPSGAAIEVSAERARSGARSFKAVLSAEGGIRFARVLREGKLFGSELTLSAWYFLPAHPQIDDYVTLMQLRGRTGPNGTGDDLALFDINLQTRDGVLTLNTYDHLRRQTLTPVGARYSPPQNQWFELSLQLNRDTEPIGFLRVRQGNQTLFEARNVSTVFTSDWLQMNVGPLTINRFPSAFVVFIDDVRITSP